MKLLKNWKKQKHPCIESSRPLDSSKLEAPCITSKPGVWLALAKPTAEDFGVLANDIVWDARIAAQNASSGKSLNWTDFAFGEPSVTVLPDNTVLVAFWRIQADGSGIGFVKLKIS